MNFLCLFPKIPVCDKSPRKSFNEEHEDLCGDHSINEFHFTLVIGIEKGGSSKGKEKAKYPLEVYH